jgi:hypothetical protein
MGLAMPERAGLLWIGTQFYKTPADFTSEAARMGISRRLTAIPRDLEISETWVFLAHPKAIVKKCPDCKPNGLGAPGVEGCEMCSGSGEYFLPGIFSVFRPDRVEQVVAESTSEEECEAIRRRGIQPVIVEPLRGE